MTFSNSLTVPLLNDAKSQLPQAICELTQGSINRNLLINRDKPPFDNRDLRRAMALSLDRQAFIDIITEGQGDIGGVMQPTPAGLWGMPPGHCQLNFGRAKRVGGRMSDYVAATAFRHSLAASARKIRSVDRETRWRWRLKVL